MCGGTTTITAALTGEERRAIQMFAAMAYGVTMMPNQRVANATNQSVSP